MTDYRKEPGFHPDVWFYDLLGTIVVHRPDLDPMVTLFDSSTFFIDYYGEADDQVELMIALIDSPQFKLTGPSNDFINSHLQGDYKNQMSPDYIAASREWLIKKGVWKEYLAKTQDRPSQFLLSDEYYHMVYGSPGSRFSIDENTYIQDGVLYSSMQTPSGLYVRRYVLVEATEQSGLYEDSCSPRDIHNHQQMTDMDRDAGTMMDRLMLHNPLRHFPRMDRVQYLLDQAIFYDNADPDRYYDRMFRFYGQDLAESLIQGCNEHGGVVRVGELVTADGYGFHVNFQPIYNDIQYDLDWGYAGNLGGEGGNQLLSAFQIMNQVFDYTHTSSQGDNDAEYDIHLPYFYEFDKIFNDRDHFIHLLLLNDGTIGEISGWDDGGSLIPHPNAQGVYGTFGRGVSAIRQLIDSRYGFSNDIQENDHFVLDGATGSMLPSLLEFVYPIQTNTEHHTLDNISAGLTIIFKMVAAAVQMYFSPGTGAMTFFSMIASTVMTAIQQIPGIPSEVKAGLSLGLSACTAKLLKDSKASGNTSSSAIGDVVGTIVTTMSKFFPVPSGKQDDLHDLVKRIEEKVPDNIKDILATIVEEEDRELNPGGSMLQPFGIMQIKKPTFTMAPGQTIKWNLQLAPKTTGKSNLQLAPKITGKSNLQLAPKTTGKSNTMLLLAGLGLLALVFLKKKD